MKKIALAIGLLSLSTTASAVDIDRCGMRLLPRETGTLTADLACPNFPGTCSNARDTACSSDLDCTAPGTCLTESPQLGKRAVLNLNGHTLTHSGPGDGVFVTESGTVNGPGTITAPNGTALRIMGHGKLTVSNLEIRDSSTGISTPLGARVSATNLSLHDVAGQCLVGAKVVKGTGVSLVRCGLDDGGLAPSAARSVARAALSASRVKISDLTATDNGGIAVGATVLKIRGGALAGNDGDFEGYDMLTYRRPRLDGTSCSKSGQLDPLSFTVVAPWGVCAAD